MHAIERARELLSNFGRIVVFTGAGVSADSGVPTFRGSSSDALWGKYDPQQLASPEGFEADPKLVYDWYTWRRSQLASVTPNPGHNAIAVLQRERGAIVITQNVDGLHERVAPSNARVLRLHGTILEDQCTDCSHRETIGLTALPPLRDCPRCLGKMRPAVVWFGESLDGATLHAADDACTSADLMIVVGTSGQVWPAAGLVHRAKRARAKVIVVNLEPSELDDLADVVLHGRAAEVLPALVQL
ncbi:MAG: NAD-dependent deacylase [Tepidisphaeraceae bacterium]